MAITLLAVGHDQKILIWNDILGACVNSLYYNCALIEYLHIHCRQCHCKYLNPFTKPSCIWGFLYSSRTLGMAINYVLKLLGIYCVFMPGVCYKI